MGIRLASAPVSWGVIMKDTPDVPPWEKVLREISQAGYTGTELGPFGYLPQDKARLEALFDELGLTLIAAFAQINLANPDRHPDEYEETLATSRFLSEMGCEWVVLSDALFVDANRSARAGRIRPEDGLSDEDWRRFVENTNAFARRALDEFGLKTVFHPHVGANVESPAEVDRLLADTEPELVGLCLDSAHCMYGGGDPVEVVRRWGSRVRFLHLKECDGAVLETVRANEWDYFRGVEKDVFPELGRGSVDFAGLLAALQEAEFDGWAVVEQDILPGRGDDPLASAIRNREYLTQLGYG